jgi:hypothetical protein
MFQGIDLLNLLHTYDEKTIRIPLSDATSDHGNNWEDEDEEKELETFEAVRQNQKACLEVLATHLGLDFDRIEENINKYTRYRQQENNSRPGARPRNEQDDPGASRPRTRARTQAQVSAPGAEDPIETQVRASQEHNSGTSITSPGSNVSGPRLGARHSSSPNDVSDSYATQPLSRDSDDDSG